MNPFKNPEVSHRQLREIHYPKCNLSVFSDVVNDKEEKELICEFGCGHSWTETIRMGNIKNYDLEVFRDNKWSKTNWGDEDKEKALFYANQCVESCKKGISDFALRTKGIRIRDKDDNIIFEWKK